MKRSSQDRLIFNGNIIFTYTNARVDQSRDMTKSVLQPIRLINNQEVDSENPEITSEFTKKKIAGSVFVIAQVQPIRATSLIKAPQAGCAGNGPYEADLESKAVRMHMLSRFRGQHFVTPVMADSAMDVMLALFVGELQNCRVSETALAAANLLSRRELHATIDRLVQAGLAVQTGHEPDGRTVGLTPLGSARMRSFVNDYPDV